MKLKHADIEIPKGTPFEHCKLYRKKYAEVLTSIVNDYADGFVLAINNEWGTGKTTFVKMWGQYLQNEGLKTLYFNAWENDFEADPMIAILSELKGLIGKKKNKGFIDLLKKGAILTKNVAPAIIKSVIEKHIKTEVIVDAIENSMKAAAEIFEKEVDEYAKKKYGLLDFKKALEKFVREEGKGRPIIFFIDELDRCRPDYAVEVLEKVKHLFSVKGIVFVLSVDKVQLEHAIEGFYGSSQINTAEYLRRFIDLEYQIPNPKAKDACEYFFDYFGFDEFFQSGNRNRHSDFQNDKERFIDTVCYCFNNSIRTLRQLEKILAYARLILKTFNPNNYVFPSMFLLLIVWRDFKPNLYEGLKNKKLSIQDCLAAIEDSLFANAGHKNFNRPSLVYLEAQIISFYNKHYYEETASQHPLITQEYEKDKPMFSTNLQNKEFDHLLKSLNHVQSQMSFSDFSLDFLFKKIDLLDNIRIT